jgi:hypothetical protein
LETQRHRGTESGRKAGGSGEVLRKWGRPEEAEREEGGEIREGAEGEVIRRCRSRTFDALRC